MGDVVTVGECRPLSKTVKFNTLKVTKAQGNKKAITGISESYKHEDYDSCKPSYKRDGCESYKHEDHDSYEYGHVGKLEAFCLRHR